MLGTEPKKTLVLMILDGWGHSDIKNHNAIAAARTPQWDKWWKNRPHMLLNASGSEVGLPDGQMGNSEVGHMHIGAGRVIHQNLSLINEAIASDKFLNNAVFLEVIKDLKASGKALHIMGLLSPGGVHSHENHLFAFLKLCHLKDFHNVCLHLFLDGRDTPPQSALASINRLNQQLKEYPVASIASLSGRYFAMDRDQRWERIALVYQLLTEGTCNHHFDSAKEAIDAFYQKGIGDEFIPPVTINAVRPLTDGDALFFFNFRADRARQLTHALIDENFDSFIRSKKPTLSHVISMTEYAKNLPTDIAFPSVPLTNTLGQVLAKNGLSQLRIAETEKYAHVTFFLNGGSEAVFENEDRILIPSAAVATYDLIPEMSAPEITGTIIKAILSNAFDVIICNLANADMVGHTGNFEATITAIETLDICLEEIAGILEPRGGSLLITADHGNAEAMFDESVDQAHTAHTSHPVPLLYISQDDYAFTEEKGNLTDIAPTVLALLNLPKPVEMTGKALLVKNPINKVTG